MERYKMTARGTGWLVVDTFDDDRIMAWGMYSDCKPIWKRLNAESVADLVEAE